MEVLNGSAQWKRVLDLVQPKVILSLVIGAPHLGQHAMYPNPLSQDNSGWISTCDIWEKQELTIYQHIAIAVSVPFTDAERA